MSHLNWTRREISGTSPLAPTTAGDDQVIVGFRGMIRAQGALPPTQTEGLVSFTLGHRPASIAPRNAGYRGITLSQPPILIPPNGCGVGIGLAGSSAMLLT